MASSSSVSSPTTRARRWRPNRGGGAGHEEEVVDWRTSTLPAVPLATGPPSRAKAAASSSPPLQFAPNRTAKTSTALLHNMGHTGREMIKRFHTQPPRKRDAFSVESTVLRRGALALDLGKKPTASTETLLAMMGQSKIPPVHHDRIHDAAPLGRAGFHRIVLKSQGTAPTAQGFNDTFGFGSTAQSLGGMGLQDPHPGFNDTLDSMTWAEQTTTVYRPTPGRAHTTPPEYRPMSVDERQEFDEAWNDPETNVEWRWLQHPDNTFLSQYIGLEHKDLSETTTSLPPPLRLTDIPSPSSRQHVSCRSRGDPTDHGTTIGPSRAPVTRRVRPRRVWRAAHTSPVEERRQLRRDVALALPVPPRIRQLATPWEHKQRLPPTSPASGGEGGGGGVRTPFEAYKESQQAARARAEEERALCRQVHLPVFLHSKELL